MAWLRILAFHLKRRTGRHISAGALMYRAGSAALAPNSTGARAFQLSSPLGDASGGPQANAPCFGGHARATTSLYEALREGQGTTLKPLQWRPAAPKPGSYTR